MSLSKLRKSVEAKTSPKSYEELFLDDFNKAYLHIEKEREQETPTAYYRPSSLGGGCKRMLFYQRTGAAKDAEKLDDEWTYNMIGITESGTDRHTRLQNVLFKMQEIGIELENIDVEKAVLDAQRMGIKTEFIEWDEERKEARCKNDDLSIWFKADGVFRYKGKEVILEIKTINGFKFQKLVKGDVPLEDHVRQDTCYAMGLGIDHILYMYEERNFMKKWVKLYKITDEDKQFMRQKVAETDDYLARNELPPMETDKCMYCSYRNICE